MKIVWDEPKQATNLARGLDFADLTEDWFADATIVPQGVSVISMRQASKKERRIL
jgi:uncharacterized DUF497 family protein